MTSTMGVGSTRFAVTSNTGPVQRKLETTKMLASLPLIYAGKDYIGWMDPEIWAGMERTLREQGVLIQPLDLTQVYTLQFLEEIYK